MGSRMIQHRMEEMTPRIGVRLGYPKELSLDCLDGVLLHGGQDEEPCVRSCRSGTGVIRPVTSACTGLPIDGAVLQIGSQGVLKRGQQRREFLLSEAGHHP